jgi:hypothetical protein
MELEGAGRSAVPLQRQSVSRPLELGKFDRGRGGHQCLCLQAIVPCRISASQCVRGTGLDPYGRSRSIARASAEPRLARARKRPAVAKLSGCDIKAHERGSHDASGNSVVLVRSEQSWHAVSRVVSDCRASRRSVTVPFYSPGSVSTMWPPGTRSRLHQYRNGGDEGSRSSWERIRTHAHSWLVR